MRDSSLLLQKKTRIVIFSVLFFSVHCNCLRENARDKLKLLRLLQLL